VAFADADGAVSAAEISRAEAFVRADSSTDALFGSRVKMLGRRVSRTVKRHLSGRIFATLVSVVGGVAAYDTQCGLKLVRARALRRLRPMLACEGFAFDVELCLLLLRGGHRVIEFPVDWHDVPGSKVRLLRDSWRMGREVFRIRQRVDSLQKAGRLTPPEPADPI
jgi:hypothetical protein